MSADKTADAIKLNLRLPKSLHKRLKQQARRNNVSLNTEIVNELAGYEAAMAKRIADILGPLLDEAVRVAAEAGTEATLLGIFRPRTEEELRERLEQVKHFREHRLAKESAPPKEPEQK